MNGTACGKDGNTWRRVDGNVVHPHRGQKSTLCSANECTRPASKSSTPQESKPDCLFSGSLAGCALYDNLAGEDVGADGTNAASRRGPRVEPNQLSALCITLHEELGGLHLDDGVGTVRHWCPGCDARHGTRRDVEISQAACHHLARERVGARKGVLFEWSCPCW